MKMASCLTKDCLLEIYLLFLSFFLLTRHVLCIRTQHKIYIDLSTQSACFRNLNATHQSGCTSDRSGNVGTIHYVQSESDFDWVYSKGPHSPYVVVLNSVDFTGSIVKNLSRSDRVNGIMVINVLANKTLTPYPPEGFSSVDQCPNDRFGLYSNIEEYRGCKNTTWNLAGTSLHFYDLGIPVFALSDQKDVEKVLDQCYFPFNEPKNNKARDYPVCSAEVKSRMDAALNSVVCMRRTTRTVLSLSGPQQYCDPLGDKNIITFLKNESSMYERKSNSVIMVTTKLDSTAMFQNEYNAADTTVVGVVTLLATAEALWKVKDKLLSNADNKDIAFAFFQGETFDYIGSSRVVYDMQKGVFPQDYSKHDSAVYVSKLKLEHINQIIELNQVGHRDEHGALWAHFDPFNSTSVKINAMVDSLDNFGKQFNVSIQPADAKLPLPPASAQRFLMARRDIPVVLLTDHQAAYTNKYYNSRFDTAEKLGGFDYPADANDTVKYNYITTQASLIANLSSTLARYLYNASSGKNYRNDVLQNISADPLTVTRLLYCFLISPNCEMFIESVEADNMQSLKEAKQPFPFYVSVGSHTNEVTQLVYSLMSRFTGQKISSSQDDCKQIDPDKLYNYVWMQGALKTQGDKELREGWCYKAIVQYTKAVSPAFEIDGYDMASGNYSSWTESRWGTQAIGVRLFLLPSPEFQASILAVGILMLVISIAFVYFCQKYSSSIFSVNSLRASRDYSPMT